MGLENFSPFLITLSAVSAVVFFYMSAWFVIGLLEKRNDVADIAWGIGFVLASVVPLVIFGIKFDRALLVTLLVMFWGFRISSHIYKRNVGKKEDKRYAVWREEWGRWFYIRSFLQVFMLQGTLLIMVVSPVLIINTFRGGEITFFDYLGLAVWALGFFFEVVGDSQLKKFLSDPINWGEIMNKGLWQYTRHPNYFGEVTLWVGIFIIGLSVPYGILGILGPITIATLILKVSGIPLLEKSFVGRPDFEKYKKETNAFFPWFKKNQ